MIFDETSGSNQGNTQKSGIFTFLATRKITGAITDFQRVSANPLLLPRWAARNWWSATGHIQTRNCWSYGHLHAFHPSLSVCSVDMVWHITKRQPPVQVDWLHWTRDLFPEPSSFIDELSARFENRLNLHPAEAVHPHEKAYSAMASALGQDPAEGNLFF
jgi:hypothetical protein